MIDNNYTVKDLIMESLEVADGGADVWKYYRVNHYFKSD